ncbi:MAG: LamG domain-containing protein [Planctomycetes bacterium]|nr:LamG domain-containing protein [Planctomycetota bacterium]
MCKELICVVAVALLTVMVSGAYGVVIGDWENQDDGWFMDAGSPPGTAFTYSNTTGVTLNSYSLRLHVPEGGWKSSIFFKLQDYPALLEAFRNATKIRFDVTRLAAEWTGEPADGGSGIHIIINAGGDGWAENVWDDLGYVGWWTYAQGDNTQSIEVDYSASLPKIDFDTVWWLEIWIITNYDGSYTSGGVHYFDNFEIPTDLTATNPNPPDLATDVLRDVDLSWKPGASAVTHDVYFGTDAAALADVNTANLASYPGVTHQNVSVNNYDPGTLELETTYYWRVDEVKAPDLWKGNVWSFTVVNYLVADDMEYYDESDNWIFDTWKDGIGDLDCKGGNGTGSTVSVSESPSLGGLQSMQLEYDNDGMVAIPCPPYQQEARAYYSVAKADVADLASGIGSDWTIQGVKALSVQFYGTASNAIESLWVELADKKGGKAMVEYGTYEGEDPADINDASWHEWKIPLAEFAGVDLADVNSMAIGVGVEGSTEPGGSGILYFDDIRLYRPECILSKRTAEFAKLDYAPTGNPAGDCRIDGGELEVLAGDWLVSDDIIATADPGAAGLVARYPLDEGSGTVAGDVSGQGHIGTITGSVEWVDGMSGYGKALEFPGDGGDYVDLGTWNPSETTGRLTAAIWIKWAGLTGNWQGVLAKRDDWSSTDTMWQVELNIDTGAIGFSRYDNYPWFGENIPPIGEWQHVAVTFDGTTSAMYIDGKSVGTSTDFSFGPKTDAHVVFGAVEGDGDNPFNGTIDEVYIYSRALSAAEVAYLADTTAGDGELYYRVPSDAELYDGEPEGSRKVDFKDLAVLGGSWLDNQEWPWE